MGVLGRSALWLIAAKTAGFALPILQKLLPQVQIK